MAETKVKAPAPLKEESIAILNFLRANEGYHFCADIAEAVGQSDKAVNPRLTSLVKRGLVVTSEDQREVKDKNGNPVTRTYKTYSISEAGLAD